MDLTWLMMLGGFAIGVFILLAALSIIKAVFKTAVKLVGFAILVWLVLLFLNIRIF